MNFLPFFGDPGLKIDLFNLVGSGRYFVLTKFKLQIPLLSFLLASDIFFSNFDHFWNIVDLFRLRQNQAYLLDLLK